MRPLLSALGLQRIRLARCFVLMVIGAVVLMLTSQGCGRSSLEPESLNDGGTSSVCGPSNCPNGCCDASGVCRTGRDVRACGSVGGRCSDCIANGFTLCNGSRVCGRNDPLCSPSTCSGCCAQDEGQRRCLSGTEGAACGRSGAQCTNCATDGRACDPATRACGTTTCNPSNCSGCCVGDKCLPGDTVAACGTKGLACDSCATGQVCRTQAGGGGVCEGTSTCGPANCGGCCNAAGQCVAGNDTTACGKQGQACAACGINQVCVQDGLPNARTCQQAQACGPTNCPGCCVGNQCVVNTTPAACGTNGQACRTCGPGQACQAGLCVQGSDCNPVNCAGCCVGDICAVGTQNTACGAGGGLCQNCSNQAPPRVCTAGTCQLPACGPATCPTGCCSGNTCVVGTQDNACGPTGGGACTDCAASGQVCVGRTCQAPCGPVNCPTGCCQPNNQCALGIANNACGTSGAACVNCQAQGSFCNSLVTPRRCNNMQTTCPAAYGGCGAGITTPITPALQNVCTDAQLDTLVAACAIGADDPGCINAVNALGGTCTTCVNAFRHPWEQKTGLFLCAASLLPMDPMGDNCRRALGCDTDCAQTSCNQCTANVENQCYQLVYGPQGQCRTFDNAANCANAQLQIGALCSNLSYPTFAQWLRGVADHFCGNGP